MTFLRIAALGLVLAAFVPAVASAQEPQTETRKQRIERLIESLGADGEGSYEVREKAQRELEKIGTPAIPALEQAAKSDDLEVASRATDALATIRKGRPGPRTKQPADQPRRGSREDTRQQQERAMRDARKELERQLPEGFRKLFKEFFNDDQPEPKAGEQDQERRRNPFRPRVRTWTWQQGPNGERRRLETGDLQTTLGLRLGPASAALRSQLGIPRLDGRVINRVSKNGYANQRGLQLYDVIVTVDGVPVRRNADLQPLLQKGCKVEVYRKSKLLQLSLPAVGGSKAKPKPGVEKDPKKKSGKKQRSF